MWLSCCATPPQGLDYAGSYYRGGAWSDQLVGHWLHFPTEAAWKSQLGQNDRFRPRATRPKSHTCLSGSQRMLSATFINHPWDLGANCTTCGSRLPLLGGVKVIKKMQVELVRSRSKQHREVFGNFVVKIYCALKFAQENAIDSGSISTILMLE